MTAHHLLILTAVGITIYPALTWANATATGHDCAPRYYDTEFCLSGISGCAEVVRRSAKAAEKGDAQGENTLGALYAHGLGVPQC